LWLVCFS